MSGSAALTLEDDDLELPEQVWALRQQGLTNQQIARKLLISVVDVHEALDKILPALTHRYRVQSISEALLNLDTIVGFHMKNAGDVESASIAIRAMCEKRFWTGITGSSDPVQLVQSSKQADGETSMSALHRGLAHLALLKKFEQLDRDGKPEEPSGDGKPGKPDADDSASDEAP
jgi:hypothetical protein